MKGKKIDTDFVSEFIANCAQDGQANPEDICNKAKLEISNIDNKIIEVERLKKTRSKLMDVISTLEKPKVDKSQDKYILEFYNISDQYQAYVICVSLQNKKSEEISSFTDLTVIKELLTIGILKRELYKVFPGPKFEDFLNFYQKTYKR